MIEIGRENCLTYESEDIYCHVVVTGFVAAIAYVYIRVLSSICNFKHNGN